MAAPALHLTNRRPFHCPNGSSTCKLTVTDVQDGTAK
jgi:hypothetical protein